MERYALIKTLLTLYDCEFSLLVNRNIAEALVSKGLATVVRYREDEENKSPHYEKLRQAEEKAEKSLVGLWNKKDIPVHRVNDVSTVSCKTFAFILPYIREQILVLVHEVPS